MNADDLRKYDCPTHIRFSQRVQELEKSDDREDQRLYLAEELRSSTVVTPDLLSQTLRRELKASLARSGMSQRALARELGISPAVITRIFQHPEKSKVETLLKIAKAMDKDLGSLLHAA